MRELSVPQAMKGSIEQELHAGSARNRFIIFGEDEKKYDRVFPHRATGVVYHPALEQANYVPSRIHRRYDAMIYLDHTKALHPLHLNDDAGQVPETYPFAF